MLSTNLSVRERTFSPLPAPTQNPTAVLAAMCLALVLVVASVSGINLALPDLAVGLNASNSQLTWVADGYTMTLASLVLPLGALGDRIGRRKLLIAGTGIFAMASLFAGRADTADELIAWRVAMGVGAAMIMPGTLSTITAVFPPERRAKGVAIWSGCAGAGAIVGLLVSGLVLEHSTWREIFTISAIAAAFAGVGAFFFAPETRDDKPQRPDILGTLLTAGTIGFTVFAIIEGGKHGWTDPTVLGAFSAAALSAMGYVFFGMRINHSVLDPRLFANRGFLTGTITVVVQFMAVMGFFFVGLQYLLLIRDYTPLQAAVALLPIGLVMLPVSAATPRLLRYVPVNVVTAGGLLMLAGAMLWASQLKVDSGYDDFLVGLILAGIGLGITGSTGTSLIVGSLPTAKQGVASAVNDSTREVGSAVGIAMVGSFFATNYRAELPDLSAVKPDVAARITDSAPVGLTIVEKLGPLSSTLTPQVQNAFMNGYSSGLVILAMFLVGGAAIAFRAPKQLSDTAHH